MAAIQQTLRPLRLAAVVLLLQLALGSHARALYHSSNDILHWFARTSKKMPDKMRYKELRDHHHGHLPYATIGNVLPADPKKQQVVFVFGEHAREIITSEVGLWLAHLLLKDHANVSEWRLLHSALEKVEPAPAGGWPATINRWIDDVLSKVIIQIVPIEGLSGRRAWEGGSLCARKSASNVDLNRNWPFAWQRASPGDEQYGGESPLSEPESRLLKHLLDERTTLGYVNVHSGEWALYTPWDSKPAYAPDLPPDLPKLVEQLGTLCNCKAGPAGAVSGYLAFGSSMDYVYVHKRVPYPLTVEVYGGGNFGMLAPGERSKLLGEYVVMDKQGVVIRNATGRRLLAAQVQQQQRQWQQQQQQAQQQQELGYRVLRDRQPSQQQQQQWPGGPLLRDMDSGNSSGSSFEPGLLHSLQGQQQQQQQQVRQLQQLAEHISPPDDEMMELVAKASASDRHCFSTFNPTDKATYDKVVADWLAAFLISLRHMVTHGLAAGAKGAAAASGREG